MTFNYRVVKRHCKETQENMYSIHEAYYEGGNEKPVSITLHPISVSFESIESIKWMLTKIKKAMEKPVLNYQDFINDREEFI